MGISKKTCEHLEDVREEAEPGTARYSHANRALQSIQALEALADENDEG